MIVLGMISALSRSCPAHRPRSLRLIVRTPTANPCQFAPLAFHQKRLLRARSAPPQNSAVPVSTLPPELQFLDLRHRLLAPPQRSSGVRLSPTRGLLGPAPDRPGNRGFPYHQRRLAARLGRHCLLFQEKSNVALIRPWNFAPCRQFYGRTLYRRGAGSGHAERFHSPTGSEKPARDDSTDSHRESDRMLARYS